MWIRISTQHLSPIGRIKIQTKNDVIHLLVTFTSHVFSKANYNYLTKNSIRSECDFIDERGKERLFDEERYKRSKGLKKLINDAIKKNDTVYRSTDNKGNNNLYISENYDGKKYAVFFRIIFLKNKLQTEKPGRNNVKIIVKSAYQKDDLGYKKVGKILELIEKSYMDGINLPEISKYS